MARLVFRVAVLFLLAIGASCKAKEDPTAENFECCKDTSGNPYGVYSGLICGYTALSEMREVILEYSQSGVTFYTVDAPCGMAIPAAPLSVSPNVFSAQITLDYGVKNCIMVYGTSSKFTMKIQSESVALLDYEGEFQNFPCEDNPFNIVCKNCFSDPPPCFSERASLRVKGKGLVAMKNLHVGDQVLTRSGSFQPVYAMDHVDGKKPTDFIQIFTDAKIEPLEITPNHLLFLATASKPVPASHVKVGDLVLGIHGPTRVTKLSNIQRNGFYNALTTSGTIVVNDIVASNYASPIATE
jgi:hypothetical protein